MQVNFLLLCNFASQLANGSPIIAGVFRGIQLSEFPLRLDPFFIATEIECDPHEAGKQEFELRMIDEDGNVIYANQIVAEFEKRDDYVPTYMYFCGQVFVDREIERPGLFRFDLVWRGETMAEARLEIRGA